jgi:hypothetical protein
MWLLLSSASGQRQTRAAAQDRSRSAAGELLVEILDRPHHAEQRL